MPLSLAALTAHTAHATLTIEGESLEVDWYPKRYTSEMMRRITALSADFSKLTGTQAIDALDTAADVLSQLVAFWDFYEYIGEDGAPGLMIALTPERLRQCSFEVLWTILSALLSEMRVGEANGTPSPAPSRATSRTATRGGSRR